jgi:hypothetical protein
MHRWFPGSFVAVALAWTVPFAAAHAQDTLVLSAEGGRAPTVGPAFPRYAGLAPFLELLSPHGTWLDLPDVGLAWRPDPVVVGADFVPYTTHGHWSESEVGWVFESDFPWGYAVFHYGRWLRDATHGWVWTPDTEWGAAWVDWRVGADRIGWMPMPPAGYAYPVAGAPLYVIVPIVYLADPGFGRYVDRAPNVAGWVSASAPCDRWWDDGTRAWPAGPRAVVGGPRGPSAPRQSRGAVAVRPPPRGVVAVRPPDGEGETRGRIVARAPSAPVDRSTVTVTPPPWGSAPPAPPPGSSARRRFGVPRTVLPAREDVGWWPGTAASVAAAADGPPSSANARSASADARDGNAASSSAARRGSSRSPAADRASLLRIPDYLLARPSGPRLGSQVEPRPSAPSRGFRGRSPTEGRLEIPSAFRADPAPEASEPSARNASPVYTTQPSAAASPARPASSPAHNADPGSSMPRVEAPSAVRGSFFSAPRR